ncbi:MAG: hypothetical protein ACPHWZ_05890 [Longimicrobiales bacterium]
MHPSLPLDPQDLLEQYGGSTPEPRLQDARVGPFMSAGAIAIAGIAVSVASGSLTGGALSLAGIPLLAGAAELLARVVHRHAHRAWQARQGTVDWRRVHERVVGELRASIERSRHALFGPRSELLTRRTQLEAGLRDARQSTAFWDEAAARDSATEMDRERLRQAIDLEQKLNAAVERLEERQHRLSEFLEQCVAKASELDFARRKLEESRRLASIADAASELIEGTEDEIDTFGQEFLADAAAAFGALGGLERLHLAESASDVPIDSIEAVADRIVESEAEEVRALGALVESLGQTDHGDDQSDP